MNTYAGSPTAAAAAAVAPARFPVEAQARAGTPKSTARAAATATARSLKLSDGLRVSSLIQSRSRPRTGAIRSAFDNGVEPTGRPRAGGSSTGSSSAYRQIPGARAAMASWVRVVATSTRSYSTSSGPKHEGQTYDRPIGWVAPQFRQRMPRMRPVVVVVAGGESVSMAMTF